MLKLRSRKLKSIPKDARKSLDVLDKVLAKYDEFGNRNRSSSGERLRKLFRPKSLSLEAIACEPGKRRQEDIRKSLDVLDSVLAEFDDGLGDSWSQLPTSDESRTDKNGSACPNGCANCGNFDFPRNRFEAASSASDGICFARSSSTNSFQTFSVDGSTSQSMPSTFEQHLRKFSPPPVPKRSPATRLSSHEDLLSACKRENDLAKRRSYAEGFRLPFSYGESSSEANWTKGYENSLSHLREGPKSMEGKSVGETRLITNRFSPSDAIKRFSASELSPSGRQLLTSVNGGVAYGSPARNNHHHSHSFKSCSASCSVSSAAGFDVPRSASTSSMELNKSRTVAQRRADFELMTKGKPEDRKKPEESRQGHLPEADSSFTSRPVTTSPFLKRKKDGDVDSNIPQSPEPRPPASCPRDGAKPQPAASRADAGRVSSTEGGDVKPGHRTDASTVEQTGSTSQASEERPGQAGWDSGHLPDAGSISGSHSRDVDVAEMSAAPESALTTEERIRHLEEKFSEVRYLLRTKQILPLTTSPPQFSPPPPPKPPRKQRDDTKEMLSEAPNDLSVADDQETASIVSETRDGHYRRHVAETGRYVTSTKRADDTKSLPASFCNGYVAKSDRLNSTSNSVVEVIPKILPAATKIPQLSFSYSMEEDMPPGAKEILTSTPKSESSPKSTFNESISSLGYGSSQSDLDLNFSSKDGDKIPVDSIKSQTLPTGMKLGPNYYSSQLDAADGESLNGSCRFRETSTPVENQEDGTEEHFRSSSAPPFKQLEDEKAEKKLRTRIFGMSRKDTKSSKSKNECNISVKSETSLDDGIILRRIETIGNEFSLPDFKTNKGPPVEEKKRRSVWKSILRRK